MLTTADTGPLFVKYNSIMRGLGCKVPFLQEQMVKLCCSSEAADAFEKRAITFETACEGANKYVTTLHAINSAVVKLSKLTKVTKVYRGMSGMTLPEQFMKANEVGVRGGIETSFMSTSVDRDVALTYASGDVGLVLEIEQGMVSRGADISFISQYPHEKEVSAQPGTILENLPSIAARNDSREIAETMHARSSLSQLFDPVRRSCLRHSLAWRCAPCM